MSQMLTINTRKRLSGRGYVLTLGVFFLSLIPTLGFAWGNSGHEAIVKLAFRLMPKEQRNRLYKILGTKDASEIGNWADRESKTHKETQHWHWVDIPASASTFDSSRDCRKECIVSKLDELEHELTRTDLLQDQKREDLLWYIHLLSDLYQPFHCYEGGATKVYVQFNGERVSLHHVWDFGIIEDHNIDAKTLHEMLKLAKRDLAKPIEHNFARIATAQHAIARKTLEKPEATLAANYAELHWASVEQALISAALQIVERTKSLQ